MNTASTCRDAQATQPEQANNEQGKASVALIDARAPRLCISQSVGQSEFILAFCLLPDSC